jgi:hypothetical protein
MFHLDIGYDLWQSGHLRKVHGGAFDDGVKNCDANPPKTQIQGKMETPCLPMCPQVFVCFWGSQKATALITFQDGNKKDVIALIVVLAKELAPLTGFDHHNHMGISL